MSDETEPIEEIAFLSRSEARVRLLEHLLEREVATRHECREQLDASRSTVSRTLDALEDRGWVESAGRSYQLTAAGAIVAESFLDLVDTIAATDELSAFLRRFPLDAFDLDLAALSDAEVVVSTPSDPYAPANEQTDLVRSADRFRGLLPAIEIDGCRTIHEQTLAGEFVAESVFSPRVAETITEGEYARLFREMVATGDHAVLVADEAIPFYLGLTDGGEVHVGVEDEDGIPRALLVAGSGPVREWAESVYEEYRSDARELSVADFE